MHRSFRPVHFLIIFVATYLILLLVAFVAIVVSLCTLKRAVTTMNIDTIQQTSVFLRRSTDVANVLTVGLVKKTPAIMLYGVSALGQSGVDAVRTSRVYLNAVLNDDGQTASLSLDGLNQSVSDVKLHTAQLLTDLHRYPFIYNTLSANHKEILNSIDANLDSTQQLLSALPNITGPGEKRYIVLLQNNMELRPTGGFLGSFAYVVFQNGAMKDLQVQDIYVPDGQLVGYVEPPYPVKYYLHQTGGWKLRDANWDPHLPTSAPAMLWFFDKGGYTNIDGLISMNLSVAQKLLSALGPMNLPDYHDEVTADNFYSLVQVETEQDFFPGATRKTDILGALARAVLRELKDLPQEKQLSVFQVFFHALSSRDVAFWFKDEGVQNLISQNHWDGRTERVMCEQQNCVADNLYIVEANIGVNKVNCCVYREATYDIWIDPDGGVRKTVRLQYQNNSPAIPQPPRYYGGAYENYLRIYTNQESTLQLTKVDGLDQPKSKILGYSWDTLGVNEYGLLTHVGGGETRPFEFTFTDTQKLDLKHPGTYNLLIQRQPGIQNNAYKIRVHYPSTQVRVSTNDLPSATIDQVDVVEFSLALDKTTHIQFTLEPRQ